MTIEEAIDLVSYKLALKNGEQALEDQFLNADIIHQAIADKANCSEKKIDLKQYMEATKLLKQHKVNAFKTENEQFLITNLEREGVLTTESGLQYEVIKNGNGAKPTSESQVTVHYRGFLISGNKFDSSYSRNKPSSFAVKKVIKGWQEGLLLMQEEAQYKFYSPQELGYGERGNDSKVPGYATLVFEVELLNIS